MPAAYDETHASRVSGRVPARTHPVRRCLCRVTTARRCAAFIARNRGTQGATSVDSRLVGGWRPAARRGVGEALRVSRPFASRAMLWTIFVVLLVLWFVGVVSSYTLGGFIHLLLVIALIAVVLQLVQGRRVV